ncbi:arrestin domain-containing protein 17 isoform X2 [Camponotus floridanus]|uniref:arrestin domain-containing protein 17 isoform X2 n=1 Tax=Camponotus floridanus TaxID=104421 RepID=UPI0009716083|nr:arrestin domain-containing protein 17 isoform X2 [Camponotus floridanus]
MARSLMTFLLQTHHPHMILDASSTGNQSCGTSVARGFILMSVVHSVYLLGLGLPSSKTHATRPRSNSRNSSIYSQMPSLRTFRIEFDRSGATYAPGEQVTGNVIIDLAREKSIRALKLSIKGEANVNWERTRTRKDSHGRNQTEVDHFRASEHYFNLTYYLFGNTTGSSSDGEVRMPAGFHKYPFTFSLPSNIPCSFEHVNGHIRYTTKAVIDRPWRFNHECKIAFTVVSSYDLNNHSQQCLGIDDETSDSFCYFCCVNMGSIKTRIKIPTTGFVPGQSIETMINLNNTSSVNVTKICVKLERPTAPMMQYDDDPPPPMPTSPDYASPNLPYPGSQPIGFTNQPSTSVNQWDIPPPSYEECMQRADSIKDHDESNYVHGANEPFAPRYPVFNFSMPYPSGK